MISQPLFYAGARQEPASGRYQDVIDPATGQVVGRTARAAAADVDAAVRSARQAFDNPAWRNLSASQRADILLGLAKTLHDNAAELIALEATSTGASGTARRTAATSPSAAALPVPAPVTISASASPRRNVSSASWGSSVSRSPGHF